MAVSEPSDSQRAAQALARLLAAAAPADRAALLRQIAAHAASGLSVIYGDRKAAEDFYRIADQLAAGNPKP